MNVAIGFSGREVVDKANLLDGAGRVDELVQRSEGVLCAIEGGDRNLRVGGRTGSQDHRKNVAHGTAIAIETRPQTRALFIASDGAAGLVVSMVHGCASAAASGQDYT